MVAYFIDNIDEFEMKENYRDESWSATNWKRKN